MNKQMLVKLDSEKLEDINKHLEDGWTVGMNWTIQGTSTIVIILNKYIPMQPMYAHPYNNGVY